MRLYDAYGRPFKSLRIAVTYLCNFNCFFCHREGVERVNDELDWTEQAIISQVAKDVGAEDVKLTGGEPLVKQGITNLVSKLDELGYNDISMTTNGFLLKEKAAELKEAGLRRVNVSLHSLKPERFAYITGVNALEKVLEGIEEARKVGLRVFINVTVLRGINEDELGEIISYAVNREMSVHLIELHPVGKAREVFSNFHGFPQDLIKKLEKEAIRTEIRALHNRMRYVMSNGAIVELVQPVSNPLFCAGCMRIRLSPDGKLYPCLNDYNHYVDVKSILRDETLSYNEKIEQLREAFYIVNRYRRPYHLWTLEFERNKIIKHWDEFKRLYMRNRRFRLDSHL